MNELKKNLPDILLGVLGVGLCFTGAFLVQKADDTKTDDDPSNDKSSTSGWVIVGFGILLYAILLIRFNKNNPIRE